MNKPTITTQDICELCAPAVATPAGAGRCVECREKGDLVGAVVWDYVGDAVRAAGRGERVTFMLTGLPAIFLEGIARTSPGTEFEGRTLLLRMNPGAARNLCIDPDLQSHESAVHWRHNADAEVIIFAPSDQEREGIGAGLGPLARIDSQTIVDRTEMWLETLGETGEPRAYLCDMLEGLRASEIFIDLEMWVDFVRAIKSQDFAYPVDVRVQNAAPALRIPRDGIAKLPAFKQGGNRKARPQDFRTAFQMSRTEVGVYAGLMTPKQEPVDIQMVREAAGTYEHHDEEDVVAALDAVTDLLDDEDNIRPGEWRNSQSTFCERVPWERIGASLFSGGRRTNRKSLGEQTLAFIEGNYRDEVTPEDRALLETLKDTIPREPRDEELEFFARWQDKLNHPYIAKAYKAWHRRLFAKEVIGHDLLSALAEGFEALIVAGADMLAEMDDPRVLVRTTQHNKAIFWEKLDSHVQKLFRFQLRSLRGLFGDCVLWDLDFCFQYDALDAVSSNDGRRIDLELYLVEARDVVDLAGLKVPPKTAPRVKATWQPGLKPKDEPISLAFPDDVDALAAAARRGAGVFRTQVFAPRSSVEETRVASTTLTDINSFNDVAQAQNGRTFDISVRPKDDVVAELRQKISNLTTSRSLDAAAAENLRSAVDSFGDRFGRAILAIADDPGSGFASDLVGAQAEAFGALCRACRVHATSERARLEIRPLVAQIGIVTSDGSDPMAIVAAWHPLRLAERRAKILDLARFIDTVLASRTAPNADLTIAFEERRVLIGRWVFPEAAVVRGSTMISVEDVAGYSLLVPADCVARSQEALETSAPSAAAKFMEAVDQYLDVHPHEATNLAAAIYNSESLTLPREIARLMTQRIHRDPVLRCDLVITHHDQERLRANYRIQNLRLGTENISETAKGFLSRLRVDVQPNRTAPGQDDAIRDIDLVFLHDAISQHAKPVWDLERSSAETLDSAFGLAACRKPRRRLTEVDAPGIGIYLTLPRPPRAVAEYQDLLYELGKEAVLPPNYHGVLIRQVQFDNPQVRDLIRRAHELAEWVVSYDKISSRQLLEKCGVQIIRDISVPGSDGRVIISAGKIDNRLKSKLREELIKSCGVSTETAVALADVVLRDVIQISGQKILSAARYANATREMIGLSVMRAHVTSALPEYLRENAKSIWISLDDYRGWFTSGRGKIADAVCVTILDTGEAFELLIQVGEAKFVAVANEMAEIKEARKQVRDTVDRLRRVFIDNEDVISRAAWCARLADLLVNRDGLSDVLPDPLRRAAFVERLSSGEVIFRISGEAVVCLHDDHATAPKLERNADQPHLRHFALPTPVIRKTLQTIAAGGLPMYPGLCDVCWYSSEALGGETRGPDLPQTTDEDLAPASQPEEMLSHTEETSGTDPESTAESNAADVEWPASGTVMAQRDIPTGASETLVQSAATGEISAAPNLPAARFIPTPIYTVLRNMATQERGAIDDTASVAWAEQICHHTQRALSHFDMQAQLLRSEIQTNPERRSPDFQRTRHSHGRQDREAANSDVDNARHRSSRRPPRARKDLSLRQAREARQGPPRFDLAGSGVAESALPGK